MKYCTKCGNEIDPNSMAYCPNCGSPVEGSKQSTSTKHSLKHEGDKKKGIKEWLSHPLLLIAVGAIISSILIPELTSSFQINEQELELKLGLADKMVTCRNDLYHIAGRNIIENLGGGRYENVTREECTEIDSILDMYYSSESDIPERWDQLINAMNILINLNRSLGPDHPYIPDSVEEQYKRAIITNVFSNLTLPINSTYVDELLRISSDGRFMFVVHRLLWSDVASEMRNLIRTVLDSDLDIYKHGIFQ